MKPLNELMEKLKILREYDAEMTAQRMMCLIFVMLNGEVQQRELVNRLGLDQTLTSRNVLALSTGMRGNEGLGLLMSEDDPADRRQKLLRLTSRGKVLRDRLIK